MDLNIQYEEVHSQQLKVGNIGIHAVDEELRLLLRIQGLPNCPEDIECIWLNRPNGPELCTLRPTLVMARLFNKWRIRIRKPIPESLNGARPQLGHVVVTESGLGLVIKGFQESHCVIGLREFDYVEQGFPSFTFPDWEVQWQDIETKEWSTLLP